MITALLIGCFVAAVYAKQQVVKFDADTIDDDTTQLIIDPRGWVGRTATEKSRSFLLPLCKFDDDDDDKGKGKGQNDDGDDEAGGAYKTAQELFIRQHHAAVTYLVHQNPQGFGIEGGPTKGSEFMWIRLSGHGDYLHLKCSAYDYGWAIQNRRDVENDHSIHVRSARPHEDSHMIAVVTPREMYEEEDPTYLPPNPQGRGAFVPTNLRDGIVVVDTTMKGEDRGRIVHLTLGEVRTATQNSGEGHHGRIVNVADGMYFIAPSLSKWNSHANVYDLKRGSKAPAHVDTVKKSQFDAVDASSLHTTKLNRDTGRLLFTAHGDANGGTSGRIVECSTNLGNDLDAGHEIRLFHNFADDDLVNGCNGGPCFGREDYSQNDGLAQHPLPLPALGSTSFTAATPDKFAYDFQINEDWNTIVSTSWALANEFDQGFNPAGVYGNHIRVHRSRGEGLTTLQQRNEPEMKLLYAVETSSAYYGGAGIVALEVRRKMADPRAEDYFVGMTLPGGLVRVYNDQPGNDATWNHTLSRHPFQIMADAAGKTTFDPFTTTFGPDSGKITNVGTGPINVPWLDLSPLLAEYPADSPYDAMSPYPFNTTAAGNPLPKVPIPLITAMEISESGNMLGAACWFSGTFLLFNITDSTDVKLIGGIGNLGGVTDVLQAVLGNPTFNPDAYVIEADYGGPGVHLKWAGAPQMITFLNGDKQVAVVNSLYSTWDDQAYSNAGGTPAVDDGSIASNGGMIAMLNTGVTNNQLDDPLDPSPMSIDQEWGHNGVVILNSELNPDMQSTEIPVDFKLRVHELHAVRKG